MPTTTLLEVQGELQGPLVVKNTFIDEDASVQSRKRWATAPETMSDWDAATSLCDGSPMTDLQSSLSSSCEFPETLTLSSVRMRNASETLSETLEGLPEMEPRKTLEEPCESFDQPHSRDQATSTDDADEEASNAPPTPRARPNRRSSMMQTQDYWPEYQPTRSKADSLPTAPAAPAAPAAPTAPAVSVAPATPPLNLCQAIGSPPLVYPAISSVPGMYDMYGCGGCHYYTPMAGFAPIMASPWPLYQPPLTYPALVLHQWQLQQAAAEQAVLNTMTTPARVWDVRALETANPVAAPVMEMEPKEDIGAILARAKWETDVHRKRNGTRRQRLWVHIYLHMRIQGKSLDKYGHPKFFDLVPALIGRLGCHTKKIHQETGAKIRIRGQGSGHLEIEGKYEAPVPLMVAISTDHEDPIWFRIAVEKMLKEIKRTEKDKFEPFLRNEDIAFDGPRFSMGLVEKHIAEAMGRPLMDQFPQTGAWHPPMEKM